MDNTVELNGLNGIITISRGETGVPVIHASSINDLFMGQGYVHARDRQVQLLLQRLIATGTMSQHLGAKEELIAIDRYVRQMNFHGPSEKEYKKTQPETKKALQSYCNGINLYLEQQGPVWEYRLMGYKPEPWKPEHTISWTRAFTWLGLSFAQGDMEKLIVQMVHNGIPDKQLKELYPYLNDTIDRELLEKVTLAPPLVPEAMKWLKKMPTMTASNNWALAPSRTKTGGAMLCGDPHLEMNRLPSIWQEMELHLPDRILVGATLPGFPSIILGHNGHVAWSATYSFMDVVDYRVEECRDGKYKRGNKWVAFKKQEETITTKKGEQLTETLYTNEHGILEGDPYKEGFYLVRDWSCNFTGGASDIDTIVKLSSIKNVKEGIAAFRNIEVSTYNWVMADDRGNIGYQMSGLCPKRPKGVSGLVPHAGWLKNKNSKGTIKSQDLPTSYNPKSGYIITANNDLNHLGKASPINLPMASYRYDRIEQLIKKKKKLLPDDVKEMHYDLYSLQGERFVKELSKEPGGLPELGQWDFMYNEESTGAMLFENFYERLIVNVFGAVHFGNEPVDHLLKETSIFNDYYGVFDDILMQKKSSWFRDYSRDELFRKSMDEALSMKRPPYGKTRKVYMRHLLFGGVLPPFLGFDHGPVTLPGSRATILQGQIYRSAGRETTFSPSFRIIADMGNRKVYTNMAGGPTDRRFSPWYTSDMENWLNGVYRETGV